MRSISDYRPSANGDGREDLVRFGKVGGGAALVGYGLVRRGFKGFGLAALGGYVAYRAWNEEPSTPVDVVRLVTVNAPREALFDLWTDTARTPEWMRFVDSAKRVDDEHVEWTLNPPKLPQTTVRLRLCDVERPSHVVWQSIEAGALSHSGRVDFREAIGHRGTEVRLAVRFASQNPISRGVLRALDRLPTLGLLEDLRNFKALAETGEVPTVEGQPRGSDSIEPPAAPPRAIDDTPHVDASVAAPYILPTEVHR